MYNSLFNLVLEDQFGDITVIERDTGKWTLFRATFKSAMEFIVLWTL